MPRRFANWSFSDVDKFLRQNGFYQNHSNSSHFFYYGTYNDQLRVVCVPFHGSEAIKLRTLKSIIAQSGIPRGRWLEE